jgi:hypothetical protein
MLEEQVVAAFRELNSVLSAHVNGYFTVIHFELTKIFYVMTNIKSLARIDLRIKFLERSLEKAYEGSIIFYPYKNDNIDPVSQSIIESVELLPCTYIQFFVMDKEITFLYHSSVNNDIEHIYKVIERYIKKLETIDEIMYIDFKGETS